MRAAATLHPIWWTLLLGISFFTPPLVLLPDFGSNPWPTALGMSVTAAVPTAWLYAIYDLASAAPVNTGRGRALFILPPVCTVAGVAATYVAAAGSTLHSAGGVVFSLGAVSYFLCLWAAATALERADTDGGKVEGARLFATVAAMLYNLIGMWALSGKLRRVAARLPACGA
ncbi:hypothetical protein P7B02_03405 [Caulobacter segnis]|uniref:hypothetical protein n=1 Tax=Caulobacter segnis TaxID=88688 RepID=UPI00240EEE7A|nr:hypothetical protein [Caulobacter segnis]MDG2520578.1 hypothetical protein [Caulobacter segnis]